MISDVHPYRFKNKYGTGVGLLPDGKLIALMAVVFR